MLRLLIVLGLGTMVGLVSGCQKAEPPAPPPKLAVDPHAANLIMGCYTVDLFDPYRINYPGPGVPKELARFLGVWKNAAWNGDWCHDLYITDVAADGTVKVIDAYGPYAPGRVEAVVFQRTGQIEDGVLRFTSLGGAPVSYQLTRDGAYLLGKRIDALGRYEITMSRAEGVALVPVPPRNPRRA